MQFLLPHGPGTLGSHIPFRRTEQQGLSSRSWGVGGDLFVTLEFNFLTSWKFTALQSLGSFSGEVELSLVGLLSVGLKARPPSLPLVFS